MRLHEKWRKTNATVAGLKKEKFLTLWEDFPSFWAQASSPQTLHVGQVFAAEYFCSKTSRPFLLSCTDWIVSLCQFRGLGSVHRSGGDGSCRRHRCHRLWMECEKHKTAVRETCVLIKTIRDAVLLYLLMVIKCIVAWNEAEQACQSFNNFSLLWCAD